MLDLKQGPLEGSLAKLKALLEDGDIVKVFHDCQQHVEQLYRHHAIKVQNIFDIRVSWHLAEGIVKALSDCVASLLMQIACSGCFSQVHTELSCILVVRADVKQCVCTKQRVYKRTNCLPAAQTQFSHAWL